MSATDVALLRPPTAMWGYNMQVTDEALERIAQAIRDRDVTIAFLQQRIADLNAQAAPVPQPVQASPPPAPSPAAPAARGRRRARPETRTTRPIPRTRRSPRRSSPGDGPGPRAGPGRQAALPVGPERAGVPSLPRRGVGRPVRGDTVIFERLCLEGFQSGLSWLTILRKRENFRAAFAGFDATAVAAFGEADVARLLADPGIVRNRAKINAVIVNARAALGLPAGLTALVWKYAGELLTTGAPRTMADVPAATPASKALSAELRRHGFTFTGPVTAYATMQACGIVNDHLAGCFARVP